MSRSRYFRCSLCDQEFNQSDIDFEARKRRHEDFHKPKAISRNITLGEVKWI